MNKFNFPYIALFLGMGFMLIVSFGGQVNEAGATKLPLLTLLIICEFAFFVTAIGAYVCFKYMRENGISWSKLVVAVLCVLSAAVFMIKGIAFWPM